MNSLPPKFQDFVISCHPDINIKHINIDNLPSFKALVEKNKKNQRDNYGCGRRGWQGKE